MGEEWLNASPILYRPVHYVYNGTEFVTSSGFVVDEATGGFTLERTLFAQRLESNHLEVYGNAVIGGNITPNGQNCAYDLGRPTERWDTAYLCNLDVAGDITIGDDCTDTLDITAFTTLNCDVVPGTTSTINIGSVTATWLSVHADTFFGTTLTLSGKGTSDSTVDADPGTTLVTKDWVEGNIADLQNDIATAGLWEENGNEVRTKTAGRFVVPNGTSDFGTTANRWANGYFNNVFTNDLHLKNERGDWTVIEEESYLSLRNNKTGKTFRLVMEEVS